MRKNYSQLPSTENISLKNEERYHTIWKCILELELFHSIQMKLKLEDLLQKSTRWHWD